MCKIIIAMSWRVKVRLSMCVHPKSYYLKIVALTLSKYIFIHLTQLDPHMGTYDRDPKGTAGRLPFLSAWAESSLYLLMW